MGFMNEMLKEAQLKKAQSATKSWRSKINRSMINMNTGMSTYEYMEPYIDTLN